MEAVMNLWFAVFSLAIQDYLSTDQTLSRPVEEWLFDEDLGFGSFQSVCQILLDSEAIRAGPCSDNLR
jgi:hypothetical protein